MSNVEPSHACPVTSEGGWSILGACGDTGTSTGTVVGIVVGVVVLAAAGVGIWWLVNKRNQ